MKKLFEVVCTNRKCGKKFEYYATADQLETALLEEECPSCGSTLRRSWAFGGYKIAQGATRKPT